MITTVLINSDGTADVDYYSRDSKSVMKKNLLGVDLSTRDTISMNKLQRIIENIDEFAIVLNAEYTLGKETVMDKILESGINLDKVYSVLRSCSMCIRDKPAKQSLLLRNLYNYETTVSDIQDSIKVNMQIMTYMLASWCKIFPLELRCTDASQRIQSENLEKLKITLAEIDKKFGTDIVNKDIDTYLKNCRSIVITINQATSHLKLRGNDKKQINKYTMRAASYFRKAFKNIGYTSVIASLPCVSVSFDINGLADWGLYSSILKGKALIKVKGLEGYRLYDIRKYTMKDKLLALQQKLNLQEELKIKPVYKGMSEESRVETISSNNILLRDLRVYEQELRDTDAAYNRKAIEALEETNRLTLEIIKEAYNNQIYCNRLVNNEIYFITDTKDLEYKINILQNLFNKFSLEDIHLETEIIKERKFTHD